MLRSTDHTSVVACLPCPLNCRDCLSFYPSLLTQSRHSKNNCWINCILLSHFWPSLGSINHWWNCLLSCLTVLSLSYLVSRILIILKMSLILATPSPKPGTPTIRCSDRQSLGCCTLFMAFSWKMRYHWYSPIFHISWVFLMVRKKIEARIPPSAIQTSHRKSFQATICMSTGKCGIKLNSRPSSLQPSRSLDHSKVNPFD